MIYNDSLSEILAPLGVNTLGTSIVLILLQQAFTYKKPVQKGGKPLKKFNCTTWYKCIYCNWIINNT